MKVIGRIRCPLFCTLLIAFLYMRTAERINEDANDNVCDCLPSCSELEYDIETTSMPRHFSIFKGKSFQKYFGPNIKQNNFAMVKLHLRSRKITAIERVAIFGLTDFIANIGGLMGLFVGFSFLSLFEIFYFIFLRYKTSWCVTHKRNNHQQPHQELGPWVVMHSK